MHGTRLGKIVRDFIPHARLGPCECEGQRIEKGCRELCGRIGECWGTFLPHGCAQLFKRDLLGQQLIEFKPLPVRIRTVHQRFVGRIGRRMVQVFKRSFETGQLQRCGNFRRQRIIHPH